MKRILILTLAVVLAALCFALPVGAESPTTNEDASAVETGVATTTTPTEAEKAPSALDWLKELYEAIPEGERDKYTEAVLGAAEIFKDSAPETPAAFVYKFMTEQTWAAVTIIALVALAIGSLGYALRCKGTGLGALKDANKLKGDTINAFANAYNEVNNAMESLAEQALSLGACAASFAKVAREDAESVRFGDRDERNFSCRVHSGGRFDSSGAGRFKDPPVIFGVEPDAVDEAGIGKGIIVAVDFLIDDRPLKFSVFSVRPVGDIERGDRPAERTQAFSAGLLQ